MLMVWVNDEATASTAVCDTSYSSAKYITPSIKIKIHSSCEIEDFTLEDVVETHL